MKKKAKEKAEQIAIAKKKMTEALNAAPVKKVEVAKNKTAAPTQVVAQITKAVQAPPIPVAKPEIAQVQVNATTVAPKVVPSPPASNTVQTAAPAPIVQPVIKA